MTAAQSAWSSEPSTIGDSDNASAIVPLVSPGDVVVVHDPQPLGLVPLLRSAGATVIWTCHVGIDQRSDVVLSAVEFLRADADAADAATFTRPAYVWTELDHELVRIIPPCIDALSPKNVPLDPEQRDAILAAAGLIGSAGRAGRPTFTRVDGNRRRSRVPPGSPRTVSVPADAPLVVQVSRWDALKDPLGVARAFADEPGLDGAHLILAGPAPSSVADDPEAQQVRRDVGRFRTSLAREDRRRVHLADLPTDDVEENGVIVNALQRRATWLSEEPGRGIRAHRDRGDVEGTTGGGGTGRGIQDQIDDGVNGVLIDLRDLTAFGNGVKRLLDDAALADRLGTAARRRVWERYLVPDDLGAYLELIAELS